MQPDDVAMSQAYPFLAGGGETGELIRSIDWSKTSLGSPGRWPQSLKTCVRIMLTSRQPIWIGWGKELIKLYNDPYKAIVGGKHPWAFGQPASIVWKDIWKDIEPMLKQVMEKDEGTYVESQLLIMERNGYSEETYYTFSYTPIPDDNGGTAGMICANTDDTDRIISDRQLRTLTQLGKKLANVQSNKEIFDNTIAAVKENPQDFPFAILYQLNENTACFTSSTAMDDGIERVPQQIDLNQQDDISRLFAKAVLERKQQVLQTPEATFGNLPKGAWERQSDQAIILPIFQGTQKDPYGFLVVGLNPYRLLDDKYSSFFNLLADQIATSFTAVLTIEEERKRTEALAEIDKAKTVFFSNISHEFRTPLALMLSPLQEVKRKEKELPVDVRENIDISYRNTIRLQKLVNTLLDFSRIEAGRMQAHYEQTDIATLTKDLASSFRSAIEKAGIQFIVECSIVEGSVYIDVDMWEKIIMNLLSNALKYTEEGQIKLQLQQNENSILVSVSDTGIGIAKEEQSKIFERFHRVQNRQGRSQEGSGIGLAMVQELIKLHHGTIHLESEPGKGSTFIVTIPIGKDHLPQEKIISGQSSAKLSNADIYVKEALKWLPSPQTLQNEEVLYTQNLGATGSNKKLKVLLADDNADMREYVARLLSSKYDVTAVANGRLALQKIHDQIPDLIISDVMMPDIDGFELVQKIKSDTATSQTPVILLSARAGEEATLEGLQTGVDDYLIKPFSSRELLSRVESVINLYQTRKATEQQYVDLFMQAPVAICMLKGHDFLIQLANKNILDIWGKSSSVVGKHLLEALPEIKGQPFPQILEEVYKTGQPFYGYETKVILNRYSHSQTRFVNFVYQPISNSINQTYAILVIAYDVTEQVEARQKVEDAEERLRIAAEGTGLATWDLNLTNHDIIYSPRLNELFGHTPSHRMLHKEMREQLHPDDVHTIVAKAFEQALQTGIYFYEARVLWKDGTIHWVRTHGKVIYNEGTPLRMLGTMMDITEQKNAELKLRESEERYRQLTQQLELRVTQRTKELSEVNANLERSNKELEQFAYVTSHDLQEPLRKIQTFANMLSENHSTGLTERAKSFLDKMQNASQRMSKLINDLLNFSRLRQSGESFTPVDLNEIFNDVRNDFELVIKQKNALIKSDDLPVIEANSLQMNQLFYNLISNALKFTKADQTPVIEITCQKRKAGETNGFAGIDWNRDYYELVFTDNGIGFAKEYEHKIFEIFQRLNGRSEYEGTGIGLALVKKILENHKGSVYAVSEEGKGSSFYILLPAVQTNVQLTEDYKTTGVEL